MMEPLCGILLCLVAYAVSSPLKVHFLNPAIELEGDFKDLNDASGDLALQSGPYSLSAIRDSTGKIGIGGGLFKTGQLALGTFGKISLTATTTMDGLFTAMMDSALLSGSRTFNPLSVTLIRDSHGLGVTGLADIGFIGGKFQGTINDPQALPKFEVHLNTDGWITAIAKGKIKDREVIMENYNAGVDLGLLAASMNMDGMRQVQNYELASSLGIFHGAMVVNRTNGNARSYRAGVSLGALNFDLIINEDNTRSYTTQVDAGILRVMYNADAQASSNWKGSIDLSNLGFNIEENPQQTSVGGRIQIGASVLVAHRVCTKTENSAVDCKFTVKVNKGSIVQ